MADNKRVLDDYPMASIPGGEVALRDDRIGKTWTVRMNAFRLGSVPVTKDFYFSILREPLRANAESNVPVTDVSWNEAIAFCNTLSRLSGLKECYSFGEDGGSVECDWDANGYRLPTEAEWQYACKAGAEGYRYGELDDIAWYRDNSGGRAREVGLKKPNAWGLYDMLGNVWEWCWDVYDPRVYGSYRIFRGGSWAEEARGCGATCRRRSHPTFGIDDLGFRLAQSIR